MYRVTLEQRVVEYVPSEEPGSTSKVQRHKWEEAAVIQGDSVIVAGALRAMADKMDPPKPTATYR